MKKSKQNKSPIKSDKGLFDHIRTITEKSDESYWNTLTDKDIQTFTPYMINRFLSMNPEWITSIDDLQRFTVGLLSKKEVFRLYNEILPKGKVFLKYIKATSSQTMPNTLAPILEYHFQVGRKELVEYLLILLRTDEGKEYIKYLMDAYGLQETEKKEIRKELKI